MRTFWWPTAIWSTSLRAAGSSASSVTSMHFSLHLLCTLPVCHSGSAQHAQQVLACASQKACAHVDCQYVSSCSSLDSAVRAETPLPQVAAMTGIWVASQQPKSGHSTTVRSQSYGPGSFLQGYPSAVAATQCESSCQGICSPMDSQHRCGSSAVMCLTVPEATQADYMVLRQQLNQMQHDFIVQSDLIVQSHAAGAAEHEPRPEADAAQLQDSVCAAGATAISVHGCSLTRSAVQ